MPLFSHEIKLYYGQSRRWRKTYRRELPMHKLLSWYRPWRNSLSTANQPLDSRLPWVTFSAIDFLKEIVRSDFRVFEWGSGASTVFLANRCHELVSIEHDPQWAEQVTRTLDQPDFHHCSLRLIVPKLLDQETDPADWTSYGSSSPEFRRHSFREYAQVIDEFKQDYFDLIIVDGRARPSCFAHALRHIKPGGFILWDDTDRATYGPTMRLANHGFVKSEFPGPKPSVASFAKTTFWQRAA